MAAAPVDIGSIGREVRAEHQHSVPWVQESFTKELFENLGAGTNHDVTRRHLHSKFAAIVRGDNLTEIGEAGGGAVMSGVVLDGTDARRQGVLRRGKRAVADLQLDNVLALRLQALGDGEDVKGSLGG